MLRRCIDHTFCASGCKFSTPLREYRRWEHAPGYDHASATFDHALPTAFVAALREEARREGWWRDVLQDPEPRHRDPRAQPQRLLALAGPVHRHCPHGALRVTTHEKFLLDRRSPARCRSGPTGPSTPRPCWNEPWFAATRARPPWPSSRRRRPCLPATRSAAVMRSPCATPPSSTSRSRSPAGTLSGAHLHGAARRSRRRRGGRVGRPAGVLGGQDLRQRRALRALGDEPGPVCRQVEAYRFVLAAQRQIVEASFAGVGGQSGGVQVRWGGPGRCRR